MFYKRHSGEPLALWMFLVALLPGVFCGYKATHFFVEYFAIFQNEDMRTAFSMLFPLSLLPIMYVFVLGYSVGHVVCLAACFLLREIVYGAGEMLKKVRSWVG